MIDLGADADRVFGTSDGSIVRLGSARDYLDVRGPVSVHGGVGIDIIRATGPTCSAAPPAATSSTAATAPTKATAGSAPTSAWPSRPTSTAKVIRRCHCPVHSSMAAPIDRRCWRKVVPFGSRAMRKSVNSAWSRKPVPTFIRAVRGFTDQDQEAAWPL